MTVVNYVHPLEGQTHNYSLCLCVCVCTAYEVKYY
jgi:hypothetical protein